MITPPYYAKKLHLLDFLCFDRCEFSENFLLYEIGFIDKQQINMYFMYKINLLYIWGIYNA